METIKVQEKNYIKMGESDVFSDLIKSKNQLIQDFAQATDETTLLITGQQLPELTPKEIENIQAFFAREKASIVLLYPTSAEAKHFKDLLDVPASEEEAKASYQLDALILRKKGKKEAFEEINILTPGYCKESYELLMNNDNGVVKKVATDFIKQEHKMVTWNDECRINAELADHIKGYLENDQIQQPINEDRTDNNLQHLAYGWTKVIHLPATFNLPGTGNRTGHFQINVFVYTCFSHNDRSNWFLVQNQCLFNPSPLYVWTSDQHQALVASRYVIDNRPGTGGGNLVNNPAVNLIRSTPFTTQHQETVTSGISYNIGGSVTVGGSEEGPSGGATLSGGVTISNSHTFTVNDVDCLNQSGSDLNNGRWDYRIKQVSGLEDGCINSLTSPAHLAVNTFQPLNQFIWKIDDSLRPWGSNPQFTFSIWLDAFLDNVWMTSNCNVFGCNCDVGRLTYRVSSGYNGPYHVTVKFPPRS